MTDAEYQAIMKNEFGAERSASAAAGSGYGKNGIRYDEECDVCGRVSDVCNGADAAKNTAPAQPNQHPAGGYSRQKDTLMKTEKGLFVFPAKKITGCLEDHIYGAMVSETTARGALVELFAPQERRFEEDGKLHLTDEYTGLADWQLRLPAIIEAINTIEAGGRMEIEQARRGEDSFNLWEMLPNLNFFDKNLTPFEEPEKLYQRLSGAKIEKVISYVGGKND
jgi:hypothetical protein